MQCYQYINDFEHGKIAGKFKFPEFPKELKGFEILSFDSLEVIDKKAKAIKKKYNIEDNEAVIGIIARIEEVKGHDTFIEAAKILLEEKSIV